MSRVLRYTAEKLRCWSKKSAEYIEQCFKSLRLSGTENPAAKGQRAASEIQLGKNQNV